MGDIDLSGIHWLGHASFRIECGAKVIYLDPWQLGGTPPAADLILITHEHFDHCSPEDVARIRSDHTSLVTTADAAANLPPECTVVQPGDTITAAGFRVTAVPAYNVNKFRSPGVPFHPRDTAKLGFVIECDGYTLYHAGDTDVIPEMSSISADIAMLPVSGTYVMTAEEAAEAVKTIGPKTAIPMHIGRSIGSLDDAQKFRELVGDRVHIPSMES